MLRVVRPISLERVSYPAVALPLLLCLGGALFLLNLGGYPIYTTGEAREAVTVADMLRGGGFILPLRAGVEIPSKPLLMHWTCALVSLVAGRLNGWTVRLPSALFAICGVLLEYLYLRQLFDQRRALLAALILATNIQYLQAGRGARVDMALTLFIEVALFEFLRCAEGLGGSPMLAYLAAALAVLTKGPVGLFLPVAIAAAWLTWERRWRLAGKLRLGAGAVLVLAIDGGWYIGAIWRGGMAFVRKQILAENLFRLLPSHTFHEGHAHPFYWMEAALLVGFVPWSLFIPAGAAALLEKRVRLDARIRYLVLWLAVVLLFYNLPRSKRGVYLLALYPALSALMAFCISGCLSADRTRRWVAATTRLCGGVLAFGGFVAAGMLAALHGSATASLSRMLWRLGVRVPGLLDRLLQTPIFLQTLTIALLVVAVGFGLYAAFYRSPGDGVVAVLACGIAALMTALSIAVEPAIGQTLSLKDFARRAVRIIDDHSAAYLPGVNYEIAFYGGKDFPVLWRNAPTKPDYLLCRAAVYQSMGPGAHRNLELVTESGPTNLDGRGAMVLLRRRTAAATGATPARRLLETPASRRSAKKAQPGAGGLPRP